MSKTKIVKLKTEIPVSRKVDKKDLGHHTWFQIEGIHLCFFLPGAGLLEPALAWAHKTCSSSMSTTGVANVVGRNELHELFLGRSVAMKMLHDYHHLRLSQRLMWWFNKFWIRQKNTWLSRQAYPTRLHSTKVMSMFEWSSNIVKIYRGAIGPCQGDDAGSGKWAGLGSIRITHTYNWYSIFDININMSYTRYTMTLAFQTQKLFFLIFCYEKLVIFLMKSLWRASKKSPGRATNPERPRPLQLGGRDSSWHRRGGHFQWKTDWNWRDIL